MSLLPTLNASPACTYFFVKCKRSMRVVFSMDFTRTRSLVVIGELANLRGLNAKTVLRTLLEVLGRALMIMYMQLMVVSTRNASLYVATLARAMSLVVQSLPAIILQSRQHAVEEAKSLSF
jgi:hypothetical protein